MRCQHDSDPWVESMTRASINPANRCRELTPGDNQDKAAEILGPLAEAGATWWMIENMWTVPGGMEAVLERVRQGPPQVR